MMITKEAREVLLRCEYFAKALRENPTGVAWEAQFSAALALLRSVGHVLDKSKTEQWWRAGQSAAVYLQGVSAEGLVAGQAPALPPVPAQPKADIYYHMNVGVFAGHDPRDLIDKAISWWNEELSKIDSR
jgi:hypothetical protein